MGGRPVAPRLWSQSVAVLLLFTASALAHDFEAELKEAPELKEASPRSQAWMIEKLKDEHHKLERLKAGYDVITGLMLFGMIASGLALLYMLNYRDSDVRAFSYNMVNTTITIFCAVIIMKTINSSSMAFVHPEEEWQRVACIMATGVVCNVFFLSMLTIGCYELRSTSTWLKAIKSIGAHLYAFSGIAIFIPLMEAKTSVRDCVSLAAAVLAAQCVVLTISSTCRARMSKSGGECKDAWPTEESEAPEWCDAAQEAEDDGTALMLSLLANMTICFGLTGEMLPYEPEADADSSFPPGALAGLAGWLAAFACAVCVTTLVKSNGIVKGPWVRALGIAHTFLAMSMGWTTLRIGVDRVLANFHEHPVIGFLAHAVAMSVGGSVLLILLDFVADRLTFAPEDAEVSTTTDEEDSEQPSEKQGSYAALGMQRRPALREVVRQRGTTEEAARTMAAKMADTNS